MPISLIPPGEDIPVVKRGRGRPPGANNKPKAEPLAAPEPEVPETVHVVAPQKPEPVAPEPVPEPVHEPAVVPQPETDSESEDDPPPPPKKVAHRLPNRNQSRNRSQRLECGASQSHRERQNGDNVQLIEMHRLRH